LLSHTITMYNQNPAFNIAGVLEFTV